MLDDLSTVLSQMKEMSMDMNTEIDRYDGIPTFILMLFNFYTYQRILVF